MASCSALLFCRRRLFRPPVGSAASRFSSSSLLCVAAAIKCRRHLSFHRGDRPLRRTQAQELIVQLNDDERSILLQELKTFEEGAGTGKSIQGNVAPPSAAQLRAVATCSAIPFVGFGFLDNFIMIIAGDYIDLSLGTTLGISTLAAAALGNLISDVAGVGSAWYVENVSAKIGVTPPVLTPEQLALSSTTWFNYLGKALGVTLGCFLGMIPLLFLPTQDKQQDKQ